MQEIDYKEFYELLSQNSDDVIWIYNLSLDRFTYVSPSVKRLRGFTQEEAQSHLIQDKLSPSSFDLVNKLLPIRIKNYESGDDSLRVQKNELEQTHKNGNLIPTEVITTLIKNDKGKVIKILGISRDFTDRKKNEEIIKHEYEALSLKYKKLQLVKEEIENSRDYIQTIFDTISDAVFLHDAQTGKIVNVNQCMCRMYECSYEQALKLTFNDISLGIKPYSQDQALKWLQKALTKGEQKFEWLAKKMTGETFWVEILLKVTKINAQQYILAVVHDISKRKNNEIALNQSEERFSKAFHSSPISSTIAGISDGKILDVNKSFENITGYTNQEAIGHTMKELNLYSHQEDRDSIIKQLNENETSINIETTIVNKSGDTRNVLVSFNTIELNSEICILSNYQDITVQKKAVQKLSESEERYRLLFNNMTNGFVLYEIITDIKTQPVDLKFITANPVYEYLFGIDDSSEKSFSSLMPQSEHHLIKTFGNIALTGKPKRFEIDSKEFDKYYLVHAFSPKPNFCAAIYNDITQRKKSETKLKLSEEKFEKAFRLSPDAIIIQNLEDGKILDVNESFIRISGYTKDEIKNKSISEINIWKESADLELLLNELNEKGKVISKEQVFKMKSGELRIGLISSEIITINQQKSILSIIRDITARKQAEEDLVESELMLKKQNDEYLALNNELMESNEQILKINEELTIAKDKAQESERLKTVFLNNMSHEIRTPMNAIIGFAELMALDFDNKDKLLEYAEIINLRCDDLLEIINDILEISKIEADQMPVHLEEIDLNDLLSEIYAFFNTHMRKIDKLHIAFKVHPFESNNHSRIITDKVKLKQILINLINNAFKFTQEGKITVSCELSNENVILFKISDTGIGIDNEKIPLIFERFMQLDNSSTRSFGGTGLGLAIVKGLLNLLGGDIIVESEPLKGSTFQFSIPFKTASITKEKSKQLEEFDLSIFKNKKVLIVEDDAYNAQYLNELLNNLGMELSAVQNGELAVNLVKSGNFYDIVLMDIRLLGMDGYTATKLLKNINPKIKIIAQTAYASQDDKIKALDAGCIDYITKPIKRQLLLSILSMYLKN